MNQKRYRIYSRFDSEKPWDPKREENVTAIIATLLIVIPGIIVLLRNLFA